jgi:glycosyltransferase involved in cell wall biosynthesis
MPSTPVASILIPTRGRPAYLDVALESIAGQARSLGAEVVVVNDGGGAAVDAVAERHGARVVPVPPPGGVNVARNAGIAAALADLIVLVDDDVRAPPGWLAALLAGIDAAPGSDVFGGPIRAVLEGGGPRTCGRERPPITTLDLGESDRDVELVWGANMALRRRALALAGPFNESLSGRGDEEEWERAVRAHGGGVRYVARAGLDHRRTAADSRLRRLGAAAYVQGRESRRFDTRKGAQPSLARELRTLAGCVWHVFRRRCLNGVVLVAHSAGRIREAVGAGHSGRVSATATVGDEAAGDDFLSGTSGQVWGIRATSQATVADLACDAAALGTLQPWRVRRAARTWPRRRVLALAVERDDVPNVLAAARAELLSSRHEVRFESSPVAGRGKFENLDLLLERVPVDGFDWLLVIDDDVALPRGFLDAFVFLAERFDLAMAQPAHRWRSHAAWNVTRRRPFSLVRETAFVEIGPLCALRSQTFETLLPFPPLQFGWGLDAHWSAVARSRGWRQGVIDATPIQHGLRRIASSYDPVDAVDEGREFLSDRPYTPAAQANRTLVTHRSWS